MTYVFIKVDFDRDAAFPVKNLKHAVSQPFQNSQTEIIENPEKSVSVQGTKAAFDTFMSYLIDESLATTFYIEARTLDIFCRKYPEHQNSFKQPFFEIGLHGYDHEDLTGEETNILLQKEEEKNIISEAKKKVEKILNTEVKGFRAPYMKLSTNTLDILSELGFIHDSSTYLESISAISPQFIDSNLIEFPVIKTPKSSRMKGMYTYLWPLFEGRRGRDEIIQNYQTLINNTKNQNDFVSINLHSWHFAYNVEEDRFLQKEEMEENISSFKMLIEALQEHEDVVFSLPKLWIKENRQE